MEAAETLNDPVFVGVMAKAFCFTLAAAARCQFELDFLGSRL
jgi:hypothetical protein